VVALLRSVTILSLPLFCLLPPRPRSTLFPYTTLFRSGFRLKQTKSLAEVRNDCACLRSARRCVGVAIGVVRIGFGSFHQVRHCRSEEHTSELQSRFDLVCRLLLEKKKKHNRSGQWDRS